MKILSIVKSFLEKESYTYDELTIESFIALRFFDYQELFQTLNFLKNSREIRATILTDLFAADFPSLKERFEIVYSLLSLELNQRFLLKINIKENEQALSIINLFRNSNWYEREIFDMFGIEFKGFPNITRILTEYGFKGFPLRKDFPLTGHLEIRYCNELNKIIHEPVLLDQEFRNFDFKSPWEGPKKTLTNSDKE